jgi:hypothetical protein
MRVRRQGSWICGSNITGKTPNINPCLHGDDLTKSAPQHGRRHSPVLPIIALCLFFLISSAILLPRSRLPISIVHVITWTTPKTEAAQWRELSNSCPPEILSLRRAELNLTKNILYSSRCVKPIYGKPNRDVVTTLSQPLIMNKTRVDLSSCTHAELPPCDHLSLEVPHPYPQKQYANLIFGVASNYDRLNASLPAIAHWLAGTGAQLIGVVPDADDYSWTFRRKFNLTALEAEFAARNVTATFAAPLMKKFIPTKPDGDDDRNRRVPVDHLHFMLIRTLLKHATPQTQWLGLLDDDTFFPSLYPLNEELAKYDHTKPTWLGALSDDTNHVNGWGIMAFGGAGIFMSLPLARELEPLLESCIAESSVTTGDGILRDCMSAHSPTKLTIMPGLHQLDIKGDASGFYESGPSPLSLHHWKSWYEEPVVAQAAITKLCGDCYLQRWRFGDEIMFSNGYSITTYNDGLDSINLSQVEGTWDDPGSQYDVSYGPIRPKLAEDQKKSYRLTNSEMAPGGSLRQFYVHKSNGLEGSLDEVVELLWERG